MDARVSTFYDTETVEGTICSAVSPEHLKVPRTAYVVNLDNGKTVMRHVDRLTPLNAAAAELLGKAL